MVQGGGVEGHVFIFFCKNTTSEVALNTTNRRILEPTKSKIPHVQRHRGSYSEMGRGAQS